MGFKILIADSNASFMSLLGRALLDSNYMLYPAESTDIALKQIQSSDIDACIIDIDLPGGIEEVIQSCLTKAKPIVAMGISPLKDTGKLVEIMYYGIPYVKKYGLEGEAKLGHIIARMNVLLRTLLILGKDDSYQIGVKAGLESKGYKVFMANNTEDFLRSFFLSEPKAILVYFPSAEDIDELIKIRKMDSNLPIAIILNSVPENIDELNNNKNTRVLTKEEISDYLDLL